MGVGMLEKSGTLNSTLANDAVDVEENVRSKASKDIIMEIKLIVVEILQAIFFQEFCTKIAILTVDWQIFLMRYFGTLVYNGCASRLSNNSCFIVV